MQASIVDAVPCYSTVRTIVQSTIPWVMAAAARHDPLSPAGLRETSIQGVSGRNNQ